MSTTTPRSFETRAFAAADARSPLAQVTIPRREPGPKDVRIDILYCGVCHSDLHQVRNEWATHMPTTYPCVPGHEIVGRVTAVGNAVRGFKEGSLAAVGCLVDSCRTCPACRDGEEQFCQAPATFTYNSADVHLSGMTYGGYSNSVVVDQDFVLRISDRLNLAAVAPLLCAGITTYSPLRHWNVREGQQVGVVVFTTSPGKTQDAIRLGAHEVVASKDADAMAKQAGTFDFILGTVSAPFDVNPYLALLKRNGTMTLVGAPDTPLPVGAIDLIFGRKRLAGSLIGGIKETQEMLDFCAERGITSDVEVIPIQKINEAYERMLKGDVKYRFVIDMASLK